MRVLILVICICSTWIQLSHCRPQSDEKHGAHRLPRYEDRIRPIARGSPEETRLILNEIDKINVAFGYKRKELIFPRNRIQSANYFYPQPVAAEFRRPPLHKLPITNKDRFARHSPLFLYELRPLPLYQNDGLRILGELYREGRQENLLVTRPETVETVTPLTEKVPEESDGPGIIETISNILPGPTEQEVEDAYDSLNESGEGSNEVEEDYEGTTLDPPLTNDKFLHQEFLQKVPKGTQRGFNFTNSFLKNLTEKFSKQHTTPSSLDDSFSDEDKQLQEKPLPDYSDDSEDTVVEGLKAPWSGYLVGGPKNQKEVLQGGGLIIQRLRVRNGSIAVAGPGGVATAGSGGTAIVGPEGLAITHPRSLTIAGQGARVYEVPESEDLEKQLLSLDSNGTPRNGRLVAIGPTIHFNGD